MNSTNSETSVSREDMASFINILRKNYEALHSYQKGQGMWTVMSCPSTSPKIIRPGPNIFTRPKIELFYCHSKLYCAITKADILNANHHLGKHKNFGTVTTFK